MTSIGKIGIVVATLGLTAALYFFGDFKGKKDVAVGEATENTPHSATNFDYQLYKQTQLQQLEPVNREAVERLEKQLADAANDEDRVATLNELIALSEQLKLDMVATMYSKQIAEIKQDSAVWNKTGTYFMELYYSKPEDSGAQPFKLEQARECFKAAVDLDTANLEYQVRLAVTYLEDQPQTMQGVTLLREVVAKDSTHISANLYLGRFGIVSGQFDKAVGRLTTVINHDPKNVEAHILMADAQLGLGNKNEAIKHLEQAKMLVNDPEFAQNIDDYIEKIKNS